MFWDFSEASRYLSGGSPLLRVKGSKFKGYFSFSRPFFKRGVTLT